MKKFDKYDVIMWIAIVGIDSFIAGTYLYCLRKGYDGFAQVLFWVIVLGWIKSDIKRFHL